MLWCFYRKVFDEYLHSETVKKMQKSYTVSKDGKEATIKLYGMIVPGEKNGAEQFVSLLEELQPKFERIRIRVHCQGGDVFEGIAIFNAIATCTAKTIAHVDGLAASMASVIVLAANEIYMAKNAYMMIHSPSGGANGNASALRDVADLLDQVGQTLGEHYETKNPSLKAEIEQLLDGNDHWLTASVAKEKGLIDGITDAIAKRELPKNYKQLSASAAYLYYFSAFSQEQTPQKNKSMNDQLKIQLLALGIPALSALQASSSDAEFEAGILKLAGENVSLRTELGALKKTEVENLIKVHDSWLKSDQQKESIRAMATASGIDAARKFCETMKPSSSTSIVNKIEGGGGHAPIMDWDWYQNNNPQALVDMEKANVTQFNALYKAKYGIAPQNA